MGTKAPPTLFNLSEGRSYCGQLSENKKPELLLFPLGSYRHSLHLLTHTNAVRQTGLAQH